MQRGGNNLINLLFEAHLTEEQKAVVRPDKHTELDKRSSFIYDKYQHRKYYDLVKSRMKSTFEESEQRVKCVQSKRVSGGAFDDFFASRTKESNGDDWHESNDGDLIDSFLSPESINKMDRKSIMDSLQRMNSKRNIVDSIGQLDIDKDNPAPSVKRLSKSMKNLGSFKEEETSPFVIKGDDVFKSPGKKKMSISQWKAKAATPTTPRGPRGGRGHFMTMMQRMDSKRELNDTILGLDNSVENGLLSPRKIAQSRRKRGDSRRRGSGDTDTKPRSKPSSARGSSQRDSSLVRDKQKGSSRRDDSIPRSSRRRPGSDDSVEKPSSIRKMRGADETPERPSSLRRIRRGKSDGSDPLGEKQESERRKRDPVRGMNRTKSMDVDSITSESSSSRRPRSSRNMKPVRRANSDALSLHLSHNSFGEESLDNQSATSSRKPPRGPTKDPGKDGIDENAKSRSRRRSPKRESQSRTPSPSSGERLPRTRSSSQRKKSPVPRKQEGAPPATSRATAPRSNRPISSRSPLVKKRTVDPQVTSGVAQLFAGD